MNLKRPDPNRFRRSRRKSIRPEPDPYDPVSPGYAERHEITEEVLPNGFTVVTLGTPVTR